MNCISENNIATCNGKDSDNEKMPVGCCLLVVLTGIIIGIIHGYNQSDASSGKDAKGEWPKHTTGVMGAYVAGGKTPPVRIRRGLLAAGYIAMDAWLRYKNKERERERNQLHSKSRDLEMLHKLLHTRGK